MAKVKGRDVVIELMDAVAKLQATTTQHADLLESMAAQAVATGAQLTALSGQMGHVSKRVNDVSHRVNDVSQRLNGLSQRLNDLSQRMDQVSQRVASLETDFHAFAENFTRSAQLSRTTEAQLGRVARLLGEFAGASNSRFDEIEGRLEKLERKAG